MKVTEEIDALRTIGVGAIELLVLPKMLALIDRVAAAYGLYRCDGRARRHGDGAHQARCQFRRFPRPSRRSDQPVLVSDRHRQGAGIRRDHRAGRLLSGLSGQRQRRQRRPADHGERGAVDFSGDRD